jgi:transposase-like protein
MSQKKAKQAEYGAGWKLAAVRRVLAGGSVREVARELGFDASGCTYGRTAMRRWAKPAWRVRAAVDRGRRLRSQPVDPEPRPDAENCWRRGSGSQSWNAKWGSRSWNWIFSAKPCGA